MSTNSSEESPLSVAALIVHKYNERQSLHTSDFAVKISIQKFIQPLTILSSSIKLTQDLFASRIDCSPSLPHNHVSHLFYWIPLSGSISPLALPLKLRETLMASDGLALKSSWWIWSIPPILPQNPHYLQQKSLIHPIKRKKIAIHMIIHFPCIKYTQKLMVDMVPSNHFAPKPTLSPTTISNSPNQKKKNSNSHNHTLSIYQVYTKFHHHYSLNLSLLLYWQSTKHPISFPIRKSILSFW